MKLFKNWEQVNDRKGDMPYLSGTSDKVVFHIQVGQTGLLKVSFIVTWKYWQMKWLCWLSRDRS